VKLALTAYVPALTGTVASPGGVYVTANVPVTGAPPTPVAVTVAACGFPSYGKGPPVAVTVGVAWVMVSDPVPVALV
jgi:hypothetical protein